MGFVMLIAVLNVCWWVLLVLQLLSLGLLCLVSC